MLSAIKPLSDGLTNDFCQREIVFDGSDCQSLVEMAIQGDGSDDHPFSTLGALFPHGSIIVLQYCSARPSALCLALGEPLIEAGSAEPERFPAEASSEWELPGVPVEPLYGDAQ